MGARVLVTVIAPALCVAIVLGLFVDQCSCQGPQVVQIGGAAGWTDTANVNYTEYMSTVTFKAGDSIRFNNTDSKEHDYLIVDTQEYYDACDANNNTGYTLFPSDSNNVVFPDPTYRVWIIDTLYCITGQKVQFTVLNADGTPVLPETGADPPSQNALNPDPETPPAPPLTPLAMAGGPSSNSANSPSRLSSMALAIVVFASYLTTPALQLRF